MNSLPSLDRLTSCLDRLPGIGRRSAERMAVKLARNVDNLIDELIRALEDVRQRVRCCPTCGSLAPADGEACRLCSSRQRDDRYLCVVEDPSDILLIEKSGGYNGRYHALMGRLSPARGEGPRDLRIKALLKRVDEGAFEEVILALSTDVEGDATASYLTELLKDKPVGVSRLAFGLPAGSGILYSDPVTLAKAIKGRQALGGRAVV